MNTEISYTETDMGEYFSKQLDGNQYGSEGSKELFKKMEQMGYVAVFGSSDDLCEFHGAINDVVDCYNGGIAFLDHQGKILYNDCKDSCPYFKKLKESAISFDIFWDSKKDYLWTYEVPFKHNTFVINEGDSAYCMGFVYNLVDAQREWINKNKLR